MRIRIVAPGKLKDKWLKDGIEEYRKRLSRYCKLEIIEVADSPDTIPVDRALAEEGKRILSKVGPEEIMWVMDLHGDLISSTKLSEYLIDDLTRGASSLTIAIGGSSGLSEEVIKRADRRICFGKITLTHMMTRLILVEQLYRGFKIHNGEKYHK